MPCTRVYACILYNNPLLTVTCSFLAGIMTKLGFNYIQLALPPFKKQGVPADPGLYGSVLTHSISYMYTNWTPKQFFALFADLNYF